MDYKYFIEYLGSLVIATANLLTESDPIVIGLIYFAVLSMTNNISTGFSNPVVPIAFYMSGRMPFEEMGYNLLAQIAGGISAIVAFKPIKVYIVDT